MVDIATAKHHGVCPECEGYSGGDIEDCPNPICIGSCPQCWCEGCHDGNVNIPEPEHGEGLAGSWEAYEALHPQPPEVHPDQLTLDAGDAA
jgi:hypothetical protein